MLTVTFNIERVKIDWVLNWNSKATWFRRHYNIPLLISIEIEKYGQLHFLTNSAFHTWVISKSMKVKIVISPSTINVSHLPSITKGFVVILWRNIANSFYLISFRFTCGLFATKSHLLANRWKHFLCFSSAITNKLHFPFAINSKKGKEHDAFTN